MRPGRMAAAVLAMLMLTAALADGGAGPDGYFGSGNDPAAATAVQAAPA